MGEEEVVRLIQEEQGDTMQQGQCWVSKVHEPEGTSADRRHPACRTGELLAFTTGNHGSAGGDLATPIYSVQVSFI